MSRPLSRNVVGGSEVESNNGLKVYCRVKPLAAESQGVTWLSILSNVTLSASSPHLVPHSKQTQFTFRHVFPGGTSQKEIFDEVALPLVGDILKGHNALLFTYGNSGSGKTYTMKGSLQQGGIMPRCLDIIFNSISSNLAKKHLYKSDKFNGFEIQSEKDADLDFNRALFKQISNCKGAKPKLGRKHNSDPDLAGRCIDSTQVMTICKKKLFSVFVTFVEIYNNSAYDLLDEYLEDNIHPKPPQSKCIREDSKKNMYVHGATEVEVQTTEEAYEVFYRGLKKRRVAQTLLNTQSSRSHSVFTIRVVQVDLTSRYTRHQPSTPPIITVGQLSLVDLAGSERTNRTQNTGKVLKEAGNINNSLMNLRLCFEALRENQNGGSRVVPYRESKLTTLFKNFFEGEGSISMIVCINPHIDDYEESLHVLKFAELSQDVQINMAVSKPTDYDGNNLYKQTLELREFDEKLMALQRERESLYLISGKSRQLLPNVEFPCDTDFIETTPKYLSLVYNMVDVINAELDAPFLQRVQSLESDVCNFMRTSIINSSEVEEIKGFLANEKQKVHSHEIQINGLKRKLDEANTNVKKLKKELFEKDKAVVKTKADIDREKEKFHQKKTVYIEKYNSELERRLRRQRTELEMEIQSKEDKLARVHRVLSDEIVSTSSTPSVASCRAKFEKFGTPSSVASTPRVTHSELRHTIRRPQVGVSNRRHRRSRSAGDVWIEHKPAMPVPLNTVFQPTMAKRRSITKLTDAKQVTQGASKYCLMTQTQDSDGDLETRLYKGDVIPTSGGGAQVLFNDMEVLKQVSPDASPKRPKDELVEPSCSLAIEKHRLRSRKH